ncbi:nucleotidyltransferase domain-containing protein [Proteus alimentorum]|uniref:Nucleotidyltransferase domain-containing protein n=1 Tax=Proteus alimentorum TaxID=1973495 RepID=A0ABS0IRT8_9GAMM|nr:nucleotidyltransferase domain-containing protein [Proteus alimentorum]MBG2874729.1 nucleotidyltransferase domain-containing protein [Proteus alimentorum]MBG2878117.1 nucleotidyltransferase domain-containing protein [Proteus alimentorum]
MHNEILKKLPQIEQEYQVKLLYVAESGSRAWGFSSTDSDYDVRGIFIRPRNAYLSIDKPKETFEWIENSWFDVGAWDITKALHLLRKSNCILLEWLQSPIIYQQYPNVQKELFELAKLYYQPKVIVHHYRGIAKVVSGYSPENNPKNEVSAEPIKLKKWFYMLRSLLSAYWTVKTDDIPPMELDKLIKILTVEEQKNIKELVEFKSDKNEHFTWVPTNAMQHLVIFLWQETNVQLTKRTVPDNDILNNWFRKKLDETDY